MTDDGQLMPPLTALLMCRNAAPTLGRHLDHLQRLGARVVAIDHGSTDAAVDLREPRRNGLVVELLHEPFEGVFSLSRQLSLKREIIQGLAPGWVLHADADEFLDSPDLTPLHELLGHWEDTGILAADCDEYLFLPGDDQESHDPAHFEDTMRHYVPIAEADPKQRIFHSSAPLDLWMKTGGHTVTRAAWQVAPERLQLRHYFGLSLDQIRSEYLSRVVDPGDLGKGWHGSRTSDRQMLVKAPDPNLLRNSDEGWSRDAPVRSPPVLAQGDADLGDTKHHQGEFDLGLISASDLMAQPVAAMLTQKFGDLRLTRVSGPRPGGPPVLGLLTHPASGAPAGSQDQSHHAENWLRLIADTRQAALHSGVVYHEIRIEDLEQNPEQLLTIARSLLSAPSSSGKGGFVSTENPPVEVSPYPDRIKAIAGALARELGYV